MREAFAKTSQRIEGKARGPALAAVPAAVPATVPAAAPAALPSGPFLSGAGAFLPKPPRMGV